MPTPVGPAPPDPDDPDLWEGWYATDDDDGEVPASSYGWVVRLVALVVAVAFAALLVFSR